MAYQDAHRAGEMLFRMYMMIRGEPYRGGVAYAGLRSAGVRTGFGDERLRVGGYQVHR